MDNQVAKDGYTMGYSKATTSSHASRTIHSDAAFLIPHIKPDFKILDVGCGPGTITLGFADLVPSGSVIGVDIADDIVSRANELGKSKGLADKVKFQHGNVLQGLPFDDNSFDVVFLSQVFGHLRAPEQPITAMKEIHRVLKIGGILAARDASVMQFYPYTAELQRLWIDNILKGTHSQWCGPFMRSWLRQAGFEVDDPRKTTIGGGATVYANPEGCQWWGEALAGRLREGDTFRQSWLSAGIPEKECDECAELLRKWGNHEDAWYGLMQSEVLARK